MTSSRPYLLRAFYDWIVDNQMTPYIVVDATVEDTIVPTQYVENGRIVLNVAFDAVKDFVVENYAVTFSARFNGNPMDIYAPMPSIVAIYAKENGRGMVFKDDEEEEFDTPPSASDDKKGGGKGKGKPFLTVVD